MSTKFQNGFELDKGVFIGPWLFVKDGLMSLLPPIWTFKFGVGTIINKLEKEKKEELDPTKFQQHFNSTLNDLVSEILIYLEERLKLTVVKNKLKCRSRNSIPGMVKCYRKYLNVNLGDLHDLSQLKEIDIKRGKKHHTVERYMPTYKICDIEYDTVEKLINLAKEVQSTVEILDSKLDNEYRIYNIRINKRPESTMVECISINHAFDLVNEKIIKKRGDIKGLDKKHVTYFAVGVNYK